MFGEWLPSQGVRMLGSHPASRLYCETGTGMLGSHPVSAPYRETGLPSIRAVLGDRDGGRVSSIRSVLVNRVTQHGRGIGHPGCWVVTQHPRGIGTPGCRVVTQHPARYWGTGMLGSYPASRRYFAKVSVDQHRYYHAPPLPAISHSRSTWPRARKDTLLPETTECQAMDYGFY